MKWFLLPVSVALSLGFLAGCLEGPQGPAGVSVTDTLLINDTTLATCSQCHNNNQTIVAKKFEWQNTLHAVGETWEGDGNRATCIACHNGSAFIFDLSSEDSATVLASPTNANCRTCHKIHTTYSDSDFALVGDGEPVESKNIAGLNFDFGKGNLCANCHQQRTNFMASVIAGTGTERVNPSNTITNTATMVGTDSIKFKATAARASNHYGSQAEILSGTGMWLPNGGAAITSSPHKTLVSDGCVQCHLGASNNHAFEPKVTACNTSACHGTFTAGPGGAFDLDSTQTEVTALAKIVRDSLLSRGILKLDTNYVFPDPMSIGFNGKGKTFSVAEVGAFVNLQAVLWDGSRGVHNAKFVKGLLNGSIADLQ